jgi:AcrR family transcriptional regulator
MNLPRGRPRDQHADAKILKAAMCLLEQHGFRAVTLEDIAEEAGVARTTVYRRWPNKAAVVMDAFLTHVAPRIAFPKHPVAVDKTAPSNAASSAGISAREVLQLCSHPVIGWLDAPPGIFG